MLGWLKYELRLWGKAASETYGLVASRVFFYALTSVGGASVAGFLQGEWRGGLIISAQTFGVVAVVLVVGTFLVNLYRVPYERHKECEALREQLTPRIDIAGVEIHVTTEKARNPQNQVVEEWQTKYVQVTVINRGVKSVIACPLLLKAEKRGPDNKWLSAYDHVIELWWSMTEGNAMSLDHEVPRMFNILRSKESENLLRPMINQPIPIPTWRFFNDPGYYRLTVGLSATDMPTQKFVLEVDNTGPWDELSVRRVA